MIYKFKAFFLSLTIVSMMMFSVYGTTIVYADDGTSTGSTETNVHATSTEESAATSDSVDETAQPEESVTPEATAQPEDQVVVTEETPQPEEAVSTETTTAPTEEVVVTEASPEPTLEQLPENTTVTVINSDGETQPLASQESADAITSATDPMWCPVGQTPGSVDCTPSFPSFTELLTFLQANQGNAAYQQAGTIYIEQGAYAGGESSIDFNNYAFTDFKNYDLKLQGGWNPSDNSTTSTSQFNAPIIVGSSLNPWVGSLTFNGLVISGVTNQAGLTAYSEGDITVSNVEVTNSQAGTELTAGGNVNVENSKFNNNKKGGAVLTGADVAVANSSFNNNSSGSKNSLTGFGLQVVSTGAVSLASVEANNNQLFGANVQAVENVNISNGFFNCNKVTTYHPCLGLGTGAVAGGYGLKVFTTGNIALNQVEAVDNYLYGASLEGANVNISTGLFSNNGSGADNNPVGYGLKIVSSKSVNLNSITSNKNQLYGADIQASGQVSILTGFFSGQQAYTFNPCTGDANYYGYGLKVVSLSDITIDGVTANSNNLWGASLDGLNVNIYNSKFNNNVTQSVVFIDDTGLLVNSLGSVYLFNVEAKENRLIGANITAVGNVSINSSTFSSNKGMTCTNAWCYHITYTGYGLKVVTSDSIFLGDVTANDNNLFGANLTGSSVTIFDSTFNNNGSGDSKDPTGKGLEVVSTGDVTLMNVNASYNELFGANIQSGGNVTVAASIFNGNKSYTYSCKGSTGQGYGIKVVTPGSINLVPGGANGSGNTASDNGAEGAILDGNNVTVVNSSFTGNGATGLTITANIAVLSNVTASNNGVDGAKVCANVVSATNNTFENNNRYGLNVGAPQIVENNNTYLGNGTAGLFANPTCIINSGNSNGNGNSNVNTDPIHTDPIHTDSSNGHGNDLHGHQFGNSYHGGSSDKSCHSVSSVKHSKR